MKHIIQNYKTGELKVEDVPVPYLRRGGLLVNNEYSLISSGTERGKIEMARGNLLQKARQRPDLVKQVMHNVKSEGLVPTAKKVFTRLNTPVSLGYCSSGIVSAVDGSTGGFKATGGFKVGDRVACVGEGFACHAEVVYIPGGFAVKVPDELTLDKASFAPLGAIAMQGVRQSGAGLGDRVAVLGLGLIGQLTVQILKASGCHVIGVDIDNEKVAMATGFSADLAMNLKEADTEQGVDGFTSSRGADVVIITASASTSQPIEMAGKLCREKGKVVLVGAVPIELPRKEYYEKELDFVVSRAFGPGSYDESYINGADYPYGYVRWTVQRNMEEIMSLMVSGKVQVDKLISGRFRIDEADKAYELVRKPEGIVMGVLFEYDGNPDVPTRVIVNEKDGKARAGARSVGFIGAGNFAQSYILPELKKAAGMELRGVATNRPISSDSVSRKFGFNYGTCNHSEILGDAGIDTVFIATRHDLHGPLTAAALNAGKSVFVEKPLALNPDELNGITEAYSKATSPYLMVGFNRRFSPLSVKLKKHFKDVSTPKVVNFRVNAGPLPPDHWLLNPVEGGGRITGEGCHFIDYLQFVTGARPVSVYAVSMDGKTREEAQNVQITINFSDGSIGNIAYIADGDPSFSREYVEVFGGGRVAVIDDFKRLTLSAKGKKKVHTLRGKDMGYAGEISEVIKTLKDGKAAPISFAELVATTLTTFAVNDSLVSAAPVAIALEITKE